MALTKLVITIEVLIKGIVILLIVLPLIKQDKEPDSVPYKLEPGELL